LSRFFYIPQAPLFGAKFASVEPALARGGWVEVTLPRVLIHEAVRVDLA
jgi:hypothetical protein